MSIKLPFVAKHNLCDLTELLKSFDKKNTDSELANISLERPDYSSDIIDIIAILEDNSTTLLGGVDSDIVEPTYKMLCCILDISQPATDDFGDLEIGKRWAIGTEDALLTHINEGLLESPAPVKNSYTDGKTIYVTNMADWFELDEPDASEFWNNKVDSMVNDGELPEVAREWSFN